MVESSIDNVCQARDRATGYGFLAWLFLENPDVDFVQGMLRGDVASPAASRSDGAGMSLGIRAGLQAMSATLAGREGSSAEELCLELAVQRTRLFRGVAPGYGPPPPYETLFRCPEPSAEAEVMLQLRRFYREVRAEIPSGREERPDYLGLELELMRLLCEEESRLWGEGDAERAARWRATQRRFLCEHLLAWVPRFCEVVRKEPNVPFYHGVATLLASFLEEEAALLRSQ